MRDVYVIGVGMTKVGRFPDMAHEEIARDAILEAMDDAGAKMKDIQALYSGSQFHPHLAAEIQKQVGMTGIPAINSTNGCATGTTAVWQGFSAVANGQFDMVLAVGTERMGKAGALAYGAFPEMAYIPEGVAGTYINPGMFAQLGVRHMAQYGTTEEHFAKVAVKNHRISVHNPRSQYRVAYTLEEVLASRVIAWPNHLYMCCPTGDCSAAIILATAEKARQFTGKPIRMAASVLATTDYSPEGVSWVDPAPMTRRAAKKAYEIAGISPKDLNVVELHDCFATAELLHYENLGLCELGEAGRMIDEGRTDYGGDIPVNMSGGLLSKGHPIGATGTAQLAELTWQLRGTAQTPERQVPNAKVALGHVQGGFEVCTVNILTR